MQKLEAQAQGERFKGRKLTYQGAALQFHTALVDAGLAKIVRLDLGSPLFAYELDVEAKSAGRTLRRQAGTRNQRQGPET